jgi:hypothetical protein
MNVVCIELQLSSLVVTACLIRLHATVLYSNAFLGFGTEKEGAHFSIELTYNYGVSSYKLVSEHCLSSLQC